MATEHDSMLFQPADDSRWSCGPFTIVKVLETVLQLERNGKTKFLGKWAHFRLETESWKALKRQVTATDRTDDFSSITKSTYFHLGTVWPQVTTRSKLSRGYVSVGKKCSSILYRQNFDILFTFCMRNYIVTIII